MKRTEENGLYYKIEGDPRWHLDIGRAMKLKIEQVPVYWEDVCPNCGNDKHISGCRCLVNHRHCPNCGYTWHWALDKINAKWVRVMSEGH